MLVGDAVNGALPMSVRWTSIALAAVLLMACGQDAATPTIPAAGLQPATERLPTAVQTELSPTQVPTPSPTLIPLAEPWSAEALSLIHI